MVLDMNSCLDRDILRRLSERYGAKIDTSRSHNIIRITADRGVCGDILEFLIYVLHRIQSEELELPSVPGVAGKEFNASEAIRVVKYREELQRLTNTIITPVSSGTGKQSSYNKVLMPLVVQISS